MSDKKIYSDDEVLAFLSILGDIFAEEPEKLFTGQQISDIIQLAVLESWSNNE